MAVLLWWVALGERQVDVAPLRAGLGGDMRSLGSGGDCVSVCYGNGGLRMRLLVLVEVWLGLG